MTIVAEIDNVIRCVNEIIPRLDEVRSFFNFYFFPTILLASVKPTVCAGFSFSCVRKVFIEKGFFLKRPQVVSAHCGMGHSFFVKCKRGIYEMVRLS